MIFRPITLQEANLFLPLVKGHLKAIQTLAMEGQTLHAVLEKERTVSTGPTSPEGLQSNAQSTMASHKQKTILKRLNQIESEIRHHIFEAQKCGAVVKCVFPAHVNFYSKRHEQPIYLNWMSGDRVVNHWHPIDENFNTRRKITRKTNGFSPSVIH